MAMHAWHGYACMAMHAILKTYIWKIVSYNELSSKIRRIHLLWEVVKYWASLL
jgi:hypothetical protein